MWQSLVTNRLFRQYPGQPAPWVGITLVLLSVFLLGIFLMHTLMPNATLIGAMAWPYASTNPPSNHTSDGPYTASKSLIRLSQLDPAQYNSTQEYNTWAYSACSAASMTEVINAYGHHYRVTDILKVESQIGEITPELGLVEEVGIQRTLARFGFKTTWGHNLSLDNVINVANQGRPVIVGFPPDRYAGGHLLVVTGGNSNSVFLADSSSYNRKVLSHTQFMKWWEGFYAIATPN
jgi:predicted double-glycine peptidase